MILLCLLSPKVLIGLSDDAEGINGTLAGDKENVLFYTYAMLGEKWCIKNEKIKKFVNGGNGSDPDSDGTATVDENAERKSETNDAADYAHDADHTDAERKSETNDVAGDDHDHDHTDATRKSEILQIFFKKCENFSKAAGVPVPTLDSSEDFKWSSVEGSSEDLFPDLQIKLVKEIISTGGVLSSVSIQETSKDYLTPEEWHEEMKQLDSDGNEDKNKNTILIDCRNHKEFSVGHFKNAIDPNTKIFAQFPRWVKENKSSLKDKKVLMYCTGGVSPIY